MPPTDVTWNWSEESPQHWRAYLGFSDGRRRIHRDYYYCGGRVTEVEVLYDGNQMVAVSCQELTSDMLGGIGDEDALKEFVKDMAFDAAHLQLTEEFERTVAEYGSE